MDKPNNEQRHQIDCHILTLDRFDPIWIDECRLDLSHQPVNQHWLPGIEGNLAEARALGFSKGSQPYVSSVDPDNRILGGTFDALLDALIQNPKAPFAWAGEQLVDGNLKRWPIKPNVWPDGYHPTLHIAHGRHVHGVKLFRRQLIEPLLPEMSSAGQACEFFLDFALSKPWTNPPKDQWPVHVPMVGRLWRQHDNNGSLFFRQTTSPRLQTNWALSPFDKCKPKPSNTSRSDS